MGVGRQSRGIYQVSQTRDFITTNTCRPVQFTYRSRSAVARDNFKGAGGINGQGKFSFKPPSLCQNSFSATYTTFPTDHNWFQSTVYNQFSPFQVLSNCLPTQNQLISHEYGTTPTLPSAANFLSSNFATSIHTPPSFCHATSCPKDSQKGQGEGRGEREVDLSREAMVESLLVKPSRRLCYFMCQGQSRTTPRQYLLATATCSLSAQASKILVGGGRCS